ncbi:MAG: prepilin-type N-terminal cleavage/methylation domain-containing protein [Candidatus Acidiferrales bacterium]|jgi:general secretion pathway protein G
MRLIDSLRDRRASRRDGAALGFTLMELMIVITIILILLAMAGGRYERSVTRAKEAALKQDLWVMRHGIEQYSLDKLTAPQSLEDLVQAGYLREVPLDPITKQADWHVSYEDVAMSPDQNGTGITDVHSSSDLLSPFENTPYSTW